MVVGGSEEESDVGTEFLVDVEGVKVVGNSVRIPYGISSRRGRTRGSKMVAGRTER